VRIRHVLLILALVACFTDAAAEGWFGTSSDEAPRVAALGATPVERRPPPTLSTLPFPTYAPTPHLAPAPPRIPETTLPPRAAEPVSDTVAAAPTSSPPAVTGATSATRTATSSVVARIKGARIVVRSAPSDESPASVLSATTEWGNARVLLTTGFAGSWVRVLLPTPPNRSEGWVRNADVVLTTTDDRIEVNLSSHTLTWSRGSEHLLETTVAVGAAGTPTPPGTYYVTDLLPEDPRGPYGAWALVLNGYSEALATFNGGLPRLAIHGTDNPTSIGRAASNGCVRVDAADLAALAAGVPVGTPVVVV
jgi:lipoprotein-anchoring transpeptidase ErfK/SrfK